jgi:hypothetical protein
VELLMATQPIFSTTTTAQPAQQTATGMMAGTTPPPTQPVNQQVQLNPGFGAVQDVQNAWMGRLQPGMDQARQAEINRLRAQGITENSDAWGRAMDTLNRGDVDARNQALLQSTNAYNDIFNRGLAQNEQVYGQGMQNKQFGLQRQNQMYGQGLQDRQFGLQHQNQMFGQNISERQQRMNEANNPYQQMMWLNSMQNNPQFGGLSQGQGANYVGAGQNQYLGNLGNWNAQTAANNGMIGGIAQLLGGWGQNQMGQQGGNNSNGAGWGGLLSGLFGW